MAKTIKYKFLCAEVNRGTEEKPDIEQVFLDKIMVCHSQEDYRFKCSIAEKEAYNGAYTVEDDGAEETVEATAQADTDAMLIDHEYRLTLLELGVTE